MSRWDFYQLFNEKGNTVYAKSELQLQIYVFQCVDANSVEQTWKTAGETEYLSVFAQQKVGLNHREESGDHSVPPYVLISLQIRSSETKGKN